MADMLEYMKTEKCGIDEKPLNEIDALILAQMSYLPFEVSDKFKDGITIGEMAESLFAIPNIAEKLLLEKDLNLLEQLRQFDRLAKLQIFDYKNHLDTETQTQFAAITVKIKKGLYCVIFRGTDQSIVGWKEDFNMSFEFPVPSQESAVKYFSNAAFHHPGRYILCGHSKGGNLAIYSATFSDTAYKTMIEKIYSFDGPGFGKNILNENKYLQIHNLISTYVPQSSIIGMTLEHEDRYTIVKSTAVGFLQHEPYSWTVDEDKFIYLNSIDENWEFIDDVMRKWLFEMNNNEREKFVDALFAIFGNAGIKSTKELVENESEDIKMILTSISKLDSDKKKILLNTLEHLFKCAAKELYQDITGKDK